MKTKQDQSGERKKLEEKIIHGFMVKGSLVGNIGMDRLLDKKKQILVGNFLSPLCEKTVREMKATCWSSELMK